MAKADGFKFDEENQVLNRRKWSKSVKTRCLTPSQATQFDTKNTLYQATRYGTSIPNIETETDLGFPSSWWYLPFRALVCRIAVRVLNEALSRRWEDEERTSQGWRWLGGAIIVHCTFPCLLSTRLWPETLVLAHQKKIRPLSWLLIKLGITQRPKCLRRCLVVCDFSL
jgi:hypothetical protein